MENETIKLPLASSRYHVKRSEKWDIWWNSLSKI